VVQNVVKINKSTEEDRHFWLGYINRLKSGIPSTGFNLSVTQKHPKTLGRACADADIIVSNDHLKYNVFKYLPDCVKTTSNGKITTARIIAFMGMTQKTIALNLLNLLSIFILKKYKSAEVQKLLDSHLFSHNVLTRGIVRYKKKTVTTKDKKKKEVNAIIHVSRPSTLVEALTGNEIKLLKAQEKPWDDIKALVENKRFEKGIPYTQIVDYVNSYKKSYNATFEITSKLSAWRAKRRLYFNKFNPQKGRNYKPFNRDMKDDFFKYLVEFDKSDQSYDDSAIDVMNFCSLYNLLNSSEHWATRYVNKSYLITPGSMAKLSKSLPDNKKDQLFNIINWIPYSKLYVDIGIEDLLLRDSSSSSDSESSEESKDPSE
jgi:hypothetical protein